MARVECYYRYATGEQIGAIVEMPTPYPDALAEAVHHALEAFAGALLEVGSADDPGDEI